MHRATLERLARAVAENTELKQFEIDEILITHAQ